MIYHQNYTLISKGENNMYRLDLSQDYIRSVLDYNPDEGILYTKLGDRINNNKMLTFFIQGKRYYLYDLAYVHVHGSIPDGLKVNFYDGNRCNIKEDNLYLI